MTMPNDQNPEPLRWEFHDFDSLGTPALFALMKLRVDVFVVEQACAYPELDMADTAPDTIHLLGYAGDELVAYARAMPGVTHCPTHCPTAAAGADPAHLPIRIGRVVIARPYRGQGLAVILIRRLMSQLRLRFPDRDYCLAAQSAVLSLYAALGFESVSEEYLEDGIAHVDMVRRAGCPQAESAAPEA